MGGIQQPQQQQKLQLQKPEDLVVVVKMEQGLLPVMVVVVAVLMGVYLGQLWSLRVPNTRVRHP
jgi:hypothetical protein